MPRPSEPTKNGSKMTVVLKAMGNSRRLQILTQLADGSEKSVSEIEQLIPNLRYPSILAGCAVPIS